VNTRSRSKGRLGTYGIMDPRVKWKTPKSKDEGKPHGPKRQAEGLDLDPNRSDLTHCRRSYASQRRVGRTGGRCTVLGGRWVRGERLYKLRDSWFSTKAIQVARVPSSPGKGRFHEGWVAPCQRVTNSEGGEQKEYIVRRWRTSAIRPEGHSPDRRIRYYRQTQFRRRATVDDIQAVRLEAAI